MTQYLIYVESDSYGSDTTGIILACGGTSSWKAADREERTKLQSISMWAAWD